MREIDAKINGIEIRTLECARELLTVGAYGSYEDINAEDVQKIVDVLQSWLRDRGVIE